MKRGGTSAFALRLPPPSSDHRTLGIVRGRQRVLDRSGIFITVVAGRRRMVYTQFNGEIELADVCKCGTDWQPHFIVTRLMSCPIDIHRAQAIQEAGE